MDQAIYDSIKEPLDRLESLVEEALDSETFALLREGLKRIGHGLGSQHSVDLSVRLEIFDREKERTLSLINSGYSCGNDGQPYRTHSDSSHQRYAVEGKIQTVPHDRCPKCWGEWDFKFTHTSCAECGATLGDDVKVLLDKDICPHCEEGRITIDNPTCSKCGFEVDSNFVTWG